MNEYDVDAETIIVPGYWANEPDPDLVDEEIAREWAADSLRPEYWAAELEGDL